VDEIDSPAGQWLSLTEASTALSVSVKTVRRRVHAGTLQSRQVGTQHGPAYEVWLPTVSPNGHSTFQGSLGQGTHGQGNHAATMLELVHLVGRLQTELVAKAEAAAMWQERCRVLEDRLQALPAPTTPQDTPQRESDAAVVVRTEETSKPEKRPWWRFWAA
jgi:hypothetical protein